MAKSIVATFKTVHLDSNGTHITAQIEYYERTNADYQNVNVGPVLIGLTEALTNTALATAVANLCNDYWGTSHLATDVLLFNGATFV